ncbi:MAG: hypothetical protein COA36_05245 [Desulfotalea sp.]|nr:MAG: hypothetical protein COA36_05245 [Desulfotalea sp.]
MNIVQIDNWQDYLREGEQFLKTADGAFRKKAKAFSPDTLYNITCMAIEKLIMAFLMKNGDLAENHTMRDLLFALEKHLGHVPGLADKLMYLDTFQEICDIDKYNIVIPTEQDVIRFLSIGKDIKELLHPDSSECVAQSTH